MKTNLKKSKNQLTEVWIKLRHVFLTLAIFSFFINALMLVPSIFMLQIYDRVLGSRNLTTLYMLVIIVLTMYMLMAAIEWVRSRILVRTGARIEEELNERIFTSAFKAVLCKKGGDTRQAINDLTNIRQFLTSTGLMAFFDTPWSLIFLAFIFILHSMLGWFALAGMLVLLALTLITEWATSKPLAKATLIGMQSSNFANNQLVNAEVIEAMGMLPSLRQRWKAQHNEMLALQAVASDRSGIISSITKFTRVSIQSLILGLGAYLVIAEGLSPGVMVVASLLVGRALAPIEQLISAWRSFISARNAYQRLNILLGEFSDENQTMPLPTPKGSLKLENVFAFPPGGTEAILKGIDFHLPEGEVLAIVGPSGSGKSTLARLLVGVWPATRGTVRLDGSDIFNWDKIELGPWIGYLPQDVELFEGTIAENIARFGEVDSTQVITAAQRASVHDLVLKLPEGYDTDIGPAGNFLSGGQRQRIALARAMYGNPSLFVFDEPNSNLDEAGELALMRAIRHLKSEGKTVVLISHRRNIVSIADKLLVLSNGIIHAYGPREKVISAMQETNKKTEVKPIK